ncbi:MAG TPA: hypothetical protein VI248_20460 [Kineosporiaceae bacterium]
MARSIDRLVQDLVLHRRPRTEVAPATYRTTALEGVEVLVAAGPASVSAAGPAAGQLPRCGERVPCRVEVTSRPE